MELLENKIKTSGVILSGNILKVGSFLNQQLDTDLLFGIGKEIYSLYKNEKITKILTIESSGIAIATAAAIYFHVPVVFAKKNKASTQTGDMFTAPIKSFTHGNTYDAIVPCDYLSKEDKVLIIDDFLARGEALRGLISILEQSEATLVGSAIAIEKGFQGGGDELRAKGYRIDSLALIDSMSPEDGIKFRH